MDTRIDEIEARLAKATPGPWGRLHDTPPTVQANDLSEDAKSPEPANRNCNCAQVWSGPWDCPVAYCAVGPDDAPTAERQMVNALFIANAPADIRHLVDRVKRLEAALREIEKGEGRYSMDPLTHAGNTIEDMIALAKAALAEPQP